MKHVLAVAVVAASFSGCKPATIAASPFDAYRYRLDPMVNRASKIDVVRVLGLPDRCEPFGTSEVCRFTSNYGMNSSSVSRGFNVGQARWTSTSGTVSTNSYDVYDMIDCEFTSTGLFVFWRATIQR